MRPSLLQVTLLGLWLVPAVASFYFHFWLFLMVSSQQLASAGSNHGLLGIQACLS